MHSILMILHLSKNNRLTAHQIYVFLTCFFYPPFALSVSFANFGMRIFGCNFCIHRLCVSPEHALLQDDRIQDGADPGHAKAFEIETRIGCQTEVTGLFKTQLADGIMGMCDAKQSFWHQLYRAHKIREKKFSLCYVRPPHASKEGTPSGAITLGGTDERLHDVGPMVYTSLVGTSSEKAENEGHSGYYDIHIREMYLREGKGGTSATSSDASASVVKSFPTCWSYQTMRSDFISTFLIFIFCTS